MLSNADGKLFLLSDTCLDVFEYNKESTMNEMFWEDIDVTWETSDLRKWLNELAFYDVRSFKNGAFTGTEWSAIADSELVNADNTDYETSGGANTTDKVFLLSSADVTNADYGFTDDNSRIAPTTAYVEAGGSIGSSHVYKNAGSNPWWLRSPGRDSTIVACVGLHGEVDRYGYLNDSAADDDGNAVRPALNVDLGKVLFTSAAVGGKQGERLTAVEAYDGSDWKLTVLDDNRAGFTAFCVGADNNVYTIRYRGATSGTNEKISAMIVDADGSVTYYGVLCDAAAGENTITVDVSGKLGDGDKLYVFNEQVNGDYKTDYASALVFIDDSFAGHDHDMGEWLPVDGDKVFHHRFCTCGADEKEAHTFDSVTQGYCAENGTVTYTCTVCGYSYSVEIPPLGHWLQMSGNMPTCTESGNVTYTCTVCGYSYSEAIPALGHDLQTTTVESTHFEAGSETKWCTRCSYKVVEEIPRLHEWAMSEWYDEGEEPTCTESGYKKYYCWECEKNFTVDIPPLGHDLATVIVKPTCTTDGYRSATCTREDCEYTEYEALPSGNYHTRDETTGLCTRCGVPVVVVTFDANGGSAVDAQSVEKDTTASYAATERSGFLLAGWALNGRLYDFSAPVTEDFTLTAVWIESTPGLAESFENIGIPDGWTGGEGWDFLDRTDAHTGTFSANCYASGGSYLIMPADLSRYAGAKLTFWYKNCFFYDTYSGELMYEDHLRVSYRVNGGEWHELFRTTGEHKAWTQATVVLPPEALQANTEIGFYGDRNRGEGVRLDDVTLFTGSHDPHFSVSGNVLTATCWNDPCALGSEKTLTLTLTAPEETAEATVIGADALQLYFGAAVGDIEYYDGETKLDAAPTKAGAYTAKVTVTADGTAYVLTQDYTIAANLRLAGDADGNGELNLKDVVLIRRYLAEGWDVTIDESAADVDGDKDVDLQDVVLITRYLAGGWDVTLV